MKRRIVLTSVACLTLAHFGAAGAQAPAAPASWPQGGPPMFGYKIAEAKADEIRAIATGRDFAMDKTPADFKELENAIPNTRFEVLETGHFAPLASPDLVIALIKKYVK